MIDTICTDDPVEGPLGVKSLGDDEQSGNHRDNTTLINSGMIEQSDATWSSSDKERKSPTGESSLPAATRTKKRMEKDAEDQTSSLRQDVVAKPAARDKTLQAIVRRAMQEVGYDEDDSIEKGLLALRRSDKIGIVL